MLAFISLTVKAGLYVGGLGAAGLSLHGNILDTNHRPWIARLALLLLICATLRLLLLNAELAGGLERMFDFSMFGWVWAPNRLQVLSYSAGGLALLAGALFRTRALLLIGALAVIAAAGLGGHTHGLESPELNPYLVSLHFAIAAFWVSAPIVLWPANHVSDDVVLYRMRRFSQFALWCVPLLFASGLWLAFQLTGSLPSMIATLYGQLLLLKLLLACAALALGAYNKMCVTQRLEIDAASGRCLLRRTLMMDAVLFAGVLLAIGAATTLTGPGA